VLVLPVPAARADFALKDGDTVVFLGDSITAARTYGKIVENYTLLRYPARKVRFRQLRLGRRHRGGRPETLAARRLRPGRLGVDRRLRPSTISAGDSRADDEHKKIYLDAIRGIIERCKERKVRVFICSAAITAEEPTKAEAGFLQRMCDEGLALSRSLGEGAIDVQRTMRSIQKRVLDANATTKIEKDKTSLHAADGVHLNDLGQLAMAFAILKGLGAPAEVSSVSIDAKGLALLDAQACQVSKISGDASRLEFDRLDDGLPINFGVFGALQFRFIPIPDELNRYPLDGQEPARRALRHRRRWPAPGNLLLAAALVLGQYRVFTADGWEPGGPWDAQAAILIRMTDARSEVAQTRRLTDHYLPTHSSRDAVHEQANDLNSRIETLQRHPSPDRPRITSSSGPRRPRFLDLLEHRTVALRTVGRARERELPDS